jgi:hypothetical protein
VDAGSSRRPLGRRTSQEIADARSEWELGFYLWRTFLTLFVATAEAADVVIALIEGRPPHSVQSCWPRSAEARVSRINEPPMPRATS